MAFHSYKMYEYQAVEINPRKSVFTKIMVVEPVETTVIQISRASMTIFLSRNRFSIVINFGF